MDNIQEIPGKANEMIVHPWGNTSADIDEEPLKNMPNNVWVNIRDVTHKAYHKYRWLYKTEKIRGQIYANVISFDVISEYQSDITLVDKGIRVAGRVFSGPDFGEIASAVVDEITYLNSITIPDRPKKVKTKQLNRYDIAKGK